MDVANEAIKGQGKSKLFIRLTAGIGELRIALRDDKNIEESCKNIDKIIFTETGLLIETKIPLFTAYFAATIEPQTLDVDNPLMKGYRKAFLKQKSADKQIKKSGSVLKGTVDRKNSKVDGIFSTMLSTMYLDRGCFYDFRDGEHSDKNLTLSDAEIAAATLHELGHVFAYFESLGITLTSNYVLRNLSESLNNADDLLMRVNFINEASGLLAVDVEDASGLAKETDNSVVLDVLISSKAAKLKSELNNSAYDHTGFEFLADQFASRHGAGEQLSGFLMKAHRFYGDPELSKGSRTFINALQLCILLSGPSAMILLAIYIFRDSVTGASNTYDTLKDRLKRIKRDAIYQLKNSNDDKKEIDRLIKTVESVSADIDKTYTHTTIFAKVAFFLSPDMRKIRDQKQLQQKLEELALSNLNVANAKLKLI